MIDGVRIAILSADNRVSGFMDNSRPAALHFYNDKLHDYLEGAAGTFSFTAPAKHRDSELLNVGNKLTFRLNNRDRYFTIIRTLQTEWEIEVTAYSLCLDMVNETVGSFTAANQMSFAQYFNEFVDEDYLMINVNEVSNLIRKQEWSGTETLLKRMYSLANAFSAEIEFVPVLNSDYTLNHIEVNVYKAHSPSAQGLGDARNDITLRYGVNISGIKRTTDISSLYTSIKGTGKDDITISSIEREVIGTDNEIAFYTEAGSPVLYAPQARSRFPSSVSADNQYICCQKQYSDAETAEELYAAMLDDLKAMSEPQLAYTVDGYADLNIGDTVRITDGEFNPPITLYARCVELEQSLTDPSVNRVVLDNFSVMASEITKRTTETIDAIARSAAHAAQQAAIAAQQSAANANRTAGTEIAVSAMSGFFLSRTGNIVTVTCSLYGDWPEGITNWGIRIPNGYRPVNTFYSASSKFIRIDGASLTSTSEAMVVIGTDGNAKMLNSAAVDSAWVLRSVFCYQTGDDFPG